MDGLGAAACTDIGSMDGLGTAARTDTESMDDSGARADISPSKLFKSFSFSTAMRLLVVPSKITLPNILRAQFLLTPNCANDVVKSSIKCKKVLLGGR